MLYMFAEKEELKRVPLVTFSTSPSLFLRSLPTTYSQMKGCRPRFLWRKVSVFRFAKRARRDANARVWAFICLLVHKDTNIRQRDRLVSYCFIKLFYEHSPRRPCQPCDIVIAHDERKKNANEHSLLNLHNLDLTRAHNIYALEATEHYTFVHCSVSKLLRLTLFFFFFKLSFSRTTCCFTVCGLSFIWPTC